MFALIPGINKVISQINYKQLVLLTLFFWAFWYAAGYIGFAFPFLELRRAVLFYLLGAVLRKTECKAGKGIFLVVFLLAWILLFAEAFSGVSKVGALEGLQAKIMGRLTPVFVDGFLVPVACISLFEFFRRINIGHNKIINAISSTTFGVYLLHDSEVGRDLLWHKIFRVAEVQYPSPYYPLLLAVTCVAVFAGCSLIDFARQKLFALASAVLERKKRGSEAAL